MYDVKNLVTMKKIILLILCGVAWSLEGFCATKIESFSVSPETKVIFSKGNVQYHPKKNLWRFAPNQYDVIGEKNAKVSISYNGWIDLFGWGTGNQPCLTTDNNKDYSNFVDWGTNFPEEDASWRTLTQKEWRYLLLERENASKLVGIGKVAGVSFGIQECYVYCFLILGKGDRRITGNLDSHCGRVGGLVGNLCSVPFSGSGVDIKVTVLV